MRTRGKPPHRTPAIRLAVAVGLLLAAGSATAARATTPERGLTVAAAVSLRTAIDDFCAGFRERHPQIAIETTYGGSNALAAQIRYGAPVDVFLSAHSEIVDELDGRGLLVAGSRIAFAGNRLLVVTSADRRIELHEASDLLRADFERIALPGPGVPLGRYARRWLERHGLLDEMMRRSVVTEHARATLAAVEHGHADLAVVYASDVTPSSPIRIALRIPADEHPPIAYEAVRIARDAARPGGAAGEFPGDADLFVRELAGVEGAFALRRAGLVPLAHAMAGSQQATDRAVGGREAVAEQADRVEP